MQDSRDPPDQFRRPLHQFHQLHQLLRWFHPVRTGEHSLPESGREREIQYFAVGQARWARRAHRGRAEIRFQAYRGVPGESGPWYMSSSSIAEWNERQDFFEENLPPNSRAWRATTKNLLPQRGGPQPNGFNRRERRERRGRPVSRE